MTSLTPGQVSSKRRDGTESSKTKVGTMPEPRATRSSLILKEYTLKKNPGYGRWGEAGSVLEGSEVEGSEVDGSQLESSELDGSQLEDSELEGSDGNVVF